MNPQDQIYSLPTNIGLAKMAYAQANGLTVNISHMAIGDGGGAVVAPGAGATGLVREVHRAQLNQLYQHPTNTNWLVAELVLPAEVGGWTIREIGLYDTLGDLIYIGNHAEQYKPVQSQGSDETKTIRMVILVSNTASVTLRTDPTTVLATVDYVQRELAKLDSKQSVRFTTKANINLSGLSVQAGGDWAAALSAGDRVLVKNQATGSQNGIYVAAAGAWVRSADADESVDVTPSLTVSVESGTTLADTVWQLITDAPIVVGTTALVFQDITNGLARLASPALTGTPTAPTAASGTNTQQLASTAFVQAAIAPLAPLASPVLTGDPKAPTPAKFDNDTSIATTAFVKAKGVEFAGQDAIVGNTTLTEAAAGKFFLYYGSANITVTMPLSATCGNAAISIINNGSGTISFAVQGADGLNYFGGITCQPNDTVMFAATPGSWNAVCGSAPLKASSQFAVSIGTSGYQKLPSGLIIQWGTVSNAASSNSSGTFPIAFPNGTLSLVLTGLQAAGNQQAYAVLNNWTNAGFTWNAFWSNSGEIPNRSGTAGQVQAKYITIGY